MPVRFLRFNLRSTSEPVRAPSLERLLACADATYDTMDWRADALAVLTPASMLTLGAGPARGSVPPLQLAPLALRASGTVPGATSDGAVLPAAAWVCLATPVHYLAELSNVRFAGDGILRLDAAEAAALAQDFNALWRGAGVQMWAQARRLVCGFDAPLEVITQDPESARGRHLHGFLPTGRDAARLRRLMSEIEMWLFEHAVNGRRKTQSMLPISGLWLWGGGAPLDSLPAVQGGVAGDDVLAEAYPVEGNRLADVMVVDVAPGSHAWAELESRWLTPTLSDLRRGQITRLDLSAGERRYTVSARWRRRFWRRAKSWWEYFE